MRRFVILGCLCCLFITCTKDYYNPIPSRYVYIEVDLAYLDKELESFLSYKIFTSKNTIRRKEFGFGFGGVLVTHTLFDEYKAFDIACPHEARSNAVIEIDDEHNAVCKVCGSKFEVIYNYSSGISIRGPSKYPLRSYPITRRDNTLFIRNN